MTDISETLSDKQHKTLAALIQYPTIREAAKASGVSETTIYRWRRESPAFREAWADASRGAYEAAREGLSALMGAANEALGEILQDANAPASARVAAARTVWTMADRGYEDAEIEALLEEVRDNG